ncbi:hypothetical protein EVAR_91091_1 [Eumeta japonica]|uniref:Uncharacterized protein n=1 Tax=Eumeta variegata TaxID=151549 RepID=A0A4C1SP77_EUMVA|nr:hypothetical protein EVAR_91091_1 [Eumeta japonica]
MSQIRNSELLDEKDITIFNDNSTQTFRFHAGTFDRKDSSTQTNDFSNILSQTDQLIGTSIDASRRIHRKPVHHIAKCRIRFKKRRTFRKLLESTFITGSDDRPLQELLWGTTL